MGTRQVAEEKTYTSTYKRLMTRQGGNGYKILIPDKDTIYIYEKCFMAASMYVGYKNRNRLYKIQDNAKEAEAKAHYMLSKIFLLFYQNNDHSIMMQVANELTRAMQFLKASKSNFTMTEMIKMAFAITQGEPAILDS